MFLAFRVRRGGGGLFLSSLLLLVFLTRLLHLGHAHLERDNVIPPLRKDDPDVSPDVSNDLKPRLGVCSPENSEGSARKNSNILLVSTLDGKISALDPHGHGDLLWSLQTEPGEMISSTISRMELTNNGRFVKLIPSLAGGLYKFDGETVEPVPLSAETLLKSSFKFADNTVITGGKHSRKYGILMDTGELKYECSMDGCRQYGSQEESLDDILILQSETQTVRAVEPRTGFEKWNFSVSQHNLDIIPGLDDGCGGEDDEVEEIDDEVDDESEQFKAVVSDGIICSVRKLRPDQINWSKKFDAPIVHAWHVVNGKAVKVDLFSSSKFPPKTPSEHFINEENEQDAGIQTPLMYIGSRNKQLYIQESDLMRSRAQQGQNVKHPVLDGETTFPKVSWRPYLISSHSRTPIYNHGSTGEEASGPPLLTYDPQVAEDTALAVFSGSDYPFDSGLYLFPDEPELAYDPVLDYNNRNTIEEPPLEGELVEAGGGEAGDEEETTQTIQIVFVSLWYWWKEVTFISFLTAVMMNVLITRPMLFEMRRNFRKRLEQLTSKKPNVVVVEVPVEVPALQHQNSEPKTPSTASLGSSELNWNLNQNQSPSEFPSRYLADFEPLQCLGKGGFGVVFEAKNKLDDRHYAVKRIQLPQRDSARKKVMREVKCLAKLDHKNIVRYFNTWLEKPPAGWQEYHDAWWKENSDLPLSGYSPRTFTDYGPTSNNDASAYADDGSESLDSLRLPQKASIENNSFSIVFENSNSHSSVSPVVIGGEDESSGGIVFDDSARKEETKDILSQKSTDSATDSKISSLSSISCDDALVWDEKLRATKSDKKCLFKSEGKEKGHEAQTAFLYIVMQLCQKESLKDWLRSNTLNRNRIRGLEMFHEICLGVEYVHGQGLIHRDLKPGNIFFTEDGTIKIGDFGLVTESDGESDKTECDFVVDSRPPLCSQGSVAALQHTDQVGTELYMSPEQLVKKAYNHKVDIYSLGLILFELLVPFATQMERVTTLSKLRKLQFPPHFINAEEYPLVRAMLNHSPDERPETFEVLETDFLVKAFETGEFGAGGDGVSRERSHSIPRRQRSKTLSSSKSVESGNIVEEEF